MGFAPWSQSLYGGDGRDPFFCRERSNFWYWALCFEAEKGGVDAISVVAVVYDTYTKPSKTTGCSVQCMPEYLTSTTCGRCCRTALTALGRLANGRAEAGGGTGGRGCGRVSLGVTPEAGPLA